MYAACLVRTGSELFVVRDALSIKPLFTMRNDNVRHMASEIGALTQIVEKPFCSDAFLETLMFGFPLGGKTSRQGIHEVRAGLNRVDYTSRPPALVPETLSDPWDDVEEIDLRQTLRHSVRACAHTHRKQGLALSGGLDSVILAHELNSLGVEDLTVFTVFV